MTCTRLVLANVVWFHCLPECFLFRYQSSQIWGSPPISSHLERFCIKSSNTHHIYGSAKCESKSLIKTLCRLPILWIFGDATIGLYSIGATNSVYFRNWILERVGHVVACSCFWVGPCTQLIVEFLPPPTSFPFELTQAFFYKINGNLEFLQFWNKGR